QYLAFFELEDQPDRPCKRMLQGGHGYVRRLPAGCSEKCSVLRILNDRDYALSNRAIGIFVIVALARASHPASCSGIDPETENALFLAASQPLIQPAVGRSRRMVEIRHRAFSVPGNSRRHVQYAVAMGPREDRLNLESLTLTFFVVCRDPF